MSISWDYPIYVIPHQMGFASIVDPDKEKAPSHLLVVLTEQQSARDFMDRFGMEGEPRPLENDREFSWLLRRLHHPVTQVTFDPEPRENDVNARWTVPVKELLDDHLVVDYSPWNYPVYAVEKADGFACITGRGDQGELTAVGIFTRSERAEAYVEAGEEQVEIHEFADLSGVRRFLESLEESVEAVALDPRAEDGRVTARHCFSRQTLLDKYLVEEEAAGSPSETSSDDQAPGDEGPARK